jgi:isopenicillin N synthase-like dioxygenase
VEELPLVDVSSADTPAGLAAAGRAMDEACRRIGFFVLSGHGVDEGLTRALEVVSRQFFAQPEADKAEIAMARSGRAWRGWFPLGDELTSGTPDQKEGWYCGEEHPPHHPRVLSGTPLHGANLYPTRPAELAELVPAWLAEMTRVGHTVMRVMAAGLGLPPNWFERELTAEPTILFRMFRYPPGDTAAWGVGEHTDYGLLTILWQDDCGGLEVRTRDGWIVVPPTPGAFVCNVGDMLDRMTGGRYRSTPHRVRNVSGLERVSMPFFFDPGWDAVVRPVPFDDERPTDDAHDRWDRSSVHEFEGTYGNYLLGKVAKVFPDLGRDVLDAPPSDSSADDSTVSR